MVGGVLCGCLLSFVVVCCSYLSSVVYFGSCLRCAVRVLLFAACRSLCDIPVRCCWLVIVGRCVLFVVCCLFVVVRGLLFVVRCSLFVVCRLSCVVCVFVRCMLMVVCRLLIVIICVGFGSCSLLVVCGLVVCGLLFAVYEAC